MVKRNIIKILYNTHVMLQDILLWRMILLHFYDLYTVIYIYVVISYYILYALLFL